MRIVDKIKILPTPYEGHYHLYIPSSKKHVLVGKQEKMVRATNRSRIYHIGLISVSREEILFKILYCS